jgi:hypothetical protein
VQVRKARPAAISPGPVGSRPSKEPTVGIHVYGGNIGTISRPSYDPATGAIRWFASGWDRPTVDGSQPRALGADVAFAAGATDASRPASIAELDRQP